MKYVIWSVLTAVNIIGLSNFYWFAERHLFTGLALTSGQVGTLVAVFGFAIILDIIYAVWHFDNLTAE